MTNKFEHEPEECARRIVTYAVLITLAVSVIGSAAIWMIAGAVLK